MSRGPTLLSGLLQADLLHLQYAKVIDLLTLSTLGFRGKTTPSELLTTLRYLPMASGLTPSRRAIRSRAVPWRSCRNAKICRDRNDPQSLESSPASSKTCLAALYCDSLLELRCVLSVSANALLTTWPDEPVHELPPQHDFFVDKDNWRALPRKRELDPRVLEIAGRLHQ